MYWLAERETIEGPDGTETRLTALSNLKDKLKLSMQGIHRVEPRLTLVTTPTGPKYGMK